MRLDPIQRIHNPQRLLDLPCLPAPHPDKLVLGLARERKVVHDVAEIVRLRVLQVWDELLRVALVRLEGAAGREVAARDGPFKRRGESQSVVLWGNRDYQGRKYQ